MVTAPVHKGIINDAGIPFTGHTEYLAEKTGTPQVVMMLAGGGLRVALATTHLPLKDVPAAITPASLEQTLRILHHDMGRKYGIENPRILVAGLNPHAGEGGYLGHEEIDVIIPVLDRLRAEGMQLIGPLPADTMFTPPLLARGQFWRRVGVGKEVLHRLEAIARSGGKTVEKVHVVVEHGQVGGKTGHGCLSV